MSTSTVKEIAFIDCAITDLDSFLAGLRPDVQPIVLAPGESAPAQIAKALRGHSGLAAIHIVAHGQAGQVSFSSGALSLETVNDHAGELATIGRALGDDGNLFLWTCRTAQGERGHAFVEALAQASGAAVAASTKLVGAVDKGGWWELDTQVGRRETMAPLTSAGKMDYAGVMATFTGTNGDDTANATTGQLIGFTGGTVQELQDGTGDTFTPHPGADIIVAGSGNDTINNFQGADSIDGGAGSDTLVLTTGGAYPDLATATDAQLTNVEVIDATIVTNSNAILNLANQTEGFIITGPTDRTIGITGSAGADTITTGSNADIITNFVGADSLDTGAGNDRLELSLTSNDLNGAADGQLVNVEEIRLTAGGVTVNLSNQSETFTAITGSTGADDITATDQVDTITGNAGNDIINAGGGNDTINGFVGVDDVDGGAGTEDTLVLTGFMVGTPPTDLANALDDNLTNVEIINATNASGTLDLHQQSDGFRINGSNNSMTITGSTGADTITAGTGNDIITGGSGNDTINGGSGTADKVILSGNRADYTISLSGSTYTIVDTRSGPSDGTDSVTNVENFQFADATFTTATLDATPPTVSSVTYGSHDGTLKAGETVTLVVTFSENVTVAGGTPTLTLDSGGIATLTGGSGTNALTFSYTVASGENTSDLAVTAFNLNGATVKDTQGNNATTTGALTNPVGILVVDTIPPDPGTLALANFTDSGSSSDFVSTDSTFDLSLSGNEGGSTIAYEVSTDGGSTWTPTTVAQSALADGNYQFRAQVSDVAGNSSPSNVVSVTVDTTAPTAGTLALANFTDSGSSSDFVSTDSTFDLSLTGQESGATVAYEVSTDGGDTWTPTTAAQTTLADDSYQFRAQVADLAGNSSPSNVVSVTVDTTAPTAPTVDALSTTDTTPVLSGTATVGAGEQLAVTVNGATYNNVSVTGGVWSIDTETATPSSGTLGAFIPGNTYNITATVTDTAGNATSDATTNELVITSAGPTTTATITNVTETTANSPSSTSLTLSGTLSAALVAGELVKVYDGATALGNAVVSGTTWSYSNVSTTAGSHTFNVEVANATSHSTASSASVLAGTTGNNSGGAALNGTSAGEYIFGFAGTDTINGFAGSDTVNGGRSTDKLVLTATSSDLNNASNVQLANVEEVSAAGALAGVAIDLHNQTEAFTITGSSSADTITGGSAVDTISGGDGADILNGGASADKLNGGAGGDSFIGGDGSDIIDVGVLNDNVQDRVQFFNASEFGDTVSNFDSTGSAGEVDVVDFGGLLKIAFDDMSGADGNFAWTTGNGSDGGNTNANLNTTVEALYLAGTNGEGVSNKDLTKASVVASEFNAEFNITANSGQDALLVVNATNSNNFAVYSYLESGSGAEIQDTELTLIGVFNSNGDVGTSQFDFI